MEKQANGVLSLIALLPEGKVENDVRITEQTITGVCTVYAKRSDGESEFLLRTIGVVSRDECNVTEAVSIATEQAYISAMKQIAYSAGPAMPEPQPKPVEVTPAPTPKQNETQTPPPAVNAAEVEGNQQDEEDAAPTGTASPPPVDIKSIIDFPEISGNNLGDDDAPPEQQTTGGIERIEFEDSGEFPDSGVLALPAGNLNNDDGSDDPEYQKALDTEITIFGKLHICTGWKAGKILSDHPETIIEFCQKNGESGTGPKYTGPRTDQKEALFKLYHEAMRRVAKAA